MIETVYAVDFDGTLCVEKWPDIGEPNTALIEFLKFVRQEGGKVILWTCREGHLLAAALLWCKARGLEFDAVNDNLPERIAQYGNNCRKVSADVYIDDKAIGMYYPARRSEFCIFNGNEIVTADVNIKPNQTAEEQRKTGIKGALIRGLAAIRRRIR